MNKLFIAGAGAGKTTFLVKKALGLPNEKILITTFTNNNSKEIENKFIELHGCIPKNVTILPWFSFLLQHGAKPFSNNVLLNGDIKGFLLVNNKSTPYLGEKKGGDKYFLNSERQIYSDKLAKFVVRCNERSNGHVCLRLSNLFSCVFIDEAQDLNGWDFEIVKLLSISVDNLVLVGDPRQRILSTHYDLKYENITIEDIKKIIKNIDVDLTTLNKTHRFDMDVCSFSNRLFPEYAPCISDVKRNDRHAGIFLIKKSDTKAYVDKFNPVALRYSKKTNIDDCKFALNFGVAKGLTFDRTIVYPTSSMADWIFNNNIQLSETTRAKFYVALTRARISVAIVVPDDRFQKINECQVWFPD